jgi:hypothetical protein
VALASKEKISKKRRLVYLTFVRAVLAEAEDVGSIKAISFFD